MAQVKRIDVGFQGGSVLALRATDDNYSELTAALEGDTRWHTLKTQDSEIRIDLSQVVYVRRDTEEHRVGF